MHGCTTNLAAPLRQPRNNSLPAIKIVKTRLKGAHPCVIHNYISEFLVLEIKTNGGWKGVIVYLKNKNNKTTTTKKGNGTTLIMVTSIHTMAFLLGSNIAVFVDTEMFQQDQER